MPVTHRVLTNTTLGDRTDKVAGSHSPMRPLYRSGREAEFGPAATVLPLSACRSVGALYSGWLGSGVSEPL